MTRTVPYTVSVRVLFAFSILLQIVLWWLRVHSFSFNPLPIIFAFGILLCNGSLSVFLLRKDNISSLILAIGTLYAQVLVLILLVASKSVA